MVTLALFVPLPLLMILLGLTVVLAADALTARKAELRTGDKLLPRNGFSVGA